MGGCGHEERRVAVTRGVENDPQHDIAHDREDERALQLVARAPAVEAHRDVLRLGVDEKTRHHLTRQQHPAGATADSELIRSSSARHARPSTLRHARPLPACLSPHLGSSHPQTLLPIPTRRHCEQKVKVTCVDPGTVSDQSVGSSSSGCYLNCYLNSSFPKVGTYSFLL